MSFWMNTIILVLGAILSPILLDKFFDWVDNRIDQKRHKQHPHYFELREEYYKVCEDNRTYYRTYVEPLKEEIDYLLDNMKYLTEDSKREREKILEKNRKELSVYLAEDEKFKRRIEELRKALQTYVEENEIEKWAGAWKRI